MNIRISKPTDLSSIMNIINEFNYDNPEGFVEECIKKEAVIVSIVDDEKWDFCCIKNSGDILLS